MHQMKVCENEKQIKIFACFMVHQTAHCQVLVFRTDSQAERDAKKQKGAKSYEA